MTANVFRMVALLALCGGPAGAETAGPISLEEISVGAVVAADALMRSATALPPGQAQAWRAAHEAAMVRAYNVLNLAAMARETVLHVHAAAVAQYGLALVCNYDNEMMPSIDRLVGWFIVDESAAFAGTDPVEARRRLLQVNWDEMLARTILRHFPCDTRARGGTRTSSAVQER